MEITTENVGYISSWELERISLALRIEAEETHGEKRQSLVDQHNLCVETYNRIKGKNVLNLMS